MLGIPSPDLRSFTQVAQAPSTERRDLTKAKMQRGAQTPVNWNTSCRATKFGLLAVRSPELETLKLN